ncbi:hypothetical protein PR003_g6455 [Phytophthora rubi]|uniref:Uncharacterized protein n=1 Tax=Phytophthora rubi TaxID=129364 RepID=A0A6A3N799_9STRA|nr:hypothetical protein PR002_g6514 [Phytophthora rubi]KAE9042628.1 hypothetical protein PR001_g6130 [Phytophthora rubi]KAE9348384.1 hypothetical protein PR003_g6455 [Phytophthora rubi]
MSSSKLIVTICLHAPWSFHSSSQLPAVQQHLPVTSPGESCWPGKFGTLLCLTALHA